MSNKFLNIVRHLKTIRAIFESALNVPNDLEIMEQCVLQKEIIPAADSHKESLAGDLSNRFRGDIQDELGDLSKKFTHFPLLPGEKVGIEIDRFNGIIQKMTQHGQPPTPEARLSKLTETLEIPPLNQL